VTDFIIIIIITMCSLFFKVFLLTSCSRAHPNSDNKTHISNK